MQASSYTVSHLVSWKIIFKHYIFCFKFIFIIYLNSLNALLWNLSANLLWDSVADLLVYNLVHSRALGLYCILALRRVYRLGFIYGLNNTFFIWNLAALLLNHLLDLCVVHNLVHVHALLLVHGGALLLDLLHVLYGALRVWYSSAVRLGDGLTLLLRDSCALLLSFSFIPDNIKMKGWKLEKFFF